MKKLFAITLMLIYGFSSTGMSISLHYCCGKLKSIDWTLPEKKCCDQQQKMGNKPCCETKLISNKEKTEQNFSRLEFKPVATALPELSQIEISIEYPRESQLLSTPFASPPLSRLPLFIKYQVFRI